MRYLKISFTALGILAITVGCNRKAIPTKADNVQIEQSEDLKTETMQTSTSSASPSKGALSHKTLADDPMKIQVYTLKNGMKLYMSVLKDAPRIQTYIATRAGSKNDPSDATGLAHYLEHMLFKGSSKIGALNWEEEQKLLKQISDLYEEHRNAAPEQRAAIYKKIDELSNKAAKLVAANEYDKMISSLGAKGTNAYTSLDQTVYINDIPSNELEKWLQVESERFNELVLRLFHTELEAVYEEFNIGQNNDGRKVFQTFMSALLPNHTYGTQTTIGTADHLKTPSMEKIHEFFETYYVPNNMAIILSGDFNPKEAIEMTERYFGSYEAKEVPKWTQEPLPERNAPVVKEVYGKEKASYQAGWILPGAESKEAMLAKLTGQLLSNGKAGLIDINLVQQQKVARQTSVGSWSANDYSFFYIYGSPRQGQTSEEAFDLVMNQVNNLKDGQFEDWLMNACINQLEYFQTKSLESNRSRANFMLESFLYQIPVQDKVSYFKQMRQITKQDIIDFAKKYLRKDNYVVVYKREGEDEAVVNVDKPTITPIEVNRSATSAFRQDFEKEESPRLKPEFLDFDKKIERSSLASGIGLEYIKNTSNETFVLEYILDMGAEHDNTLPMAIKYLKYLGTDKYSAKELQEEFFKLGVSFNVYTAGDVSYVTLSGLERSLEKGVELFEHILANAKGDEGMLKKLIAQTKKERDDLKKDKGQILRRGMVAYAKYGMNSPLKSKISNTELDALQSEELVTKIKSLTNFKHRVFYYGSKSATDVRGILDRLHKTEKNLKDIPAKKEFAELKTDKNKVVFVNFEGMAQAEIMLVSRGTEQFDVEEKILTSLYNQYFGTGLSSIVFQEIRESRALAYSAYAYNSEPSSKDKSHYFYAYIGTQSDKVKDAIPAMREIIEELPMAEDQLANAADALVKKIESERIIKDDIYWNYLKHKKQGLKTDVREQVYKFYSSKLDDTRALVEAVKEFHAAKIKGRTYTILVLGDKSKLDMNYVKSLGEFEEKTIDELF